MGAAIYHALFLVIALSPAVVLGGAPVESATGAPEYETHFEQPGEDRFEGIEPEHEGLLEESELDPDRTLLRFDVRDDGSADARVEYRFAIPQSDQADAFDALQRDIETNEEQYLTRFERRVADTVLAGEESTDRSMDAVNVALSTETAQLPQPYGAVVYTFTWEEFATVRDDTVLVGDALAGFYLDEESELQITWSDAYDGETISSTVDERQANAAVWSGPRWFDQTGPQVVLTSDGSSVDYLPSVLLGLSVLFALSGVVFWWRGGHAGGRDEPPTPSASTSGAVTPVASDRETASDPEPSGSTPPSAEPPELLSNEERVLWVLEQYGGRVKQQAVVETLEWSDAKASRVISTLRNDGKIEGFRLGNENVLTLTTRDEEDS